MSHTKISISVSDLLLRQIDAARNTTGETRSGLIGRLLRGWLEAREGEVMPPASRTSPARKREKDR